MLLHTVTFGITGIVYRPDVSGYLNRYDIFYFNTLRDDLR
jgi:hypothetical protein